MIYFNYSGPGAPPRDVICDALSSTSIKMEWSSPPQKHSHGVIKSYRVTYTRDSQHGESICLTACIYRVTYISGSQHGESICLSVCIYRDTYISGSQHDEFICLFDNINRVIYTRDSQNGEFIS